MSRPWRLTRPTGDWIRTLFPWAVFATLTFRDEVHERQAFERFTWFAQRLARAGKPRHVALAWFGDFQARGAFHFHVLVASLDDRHGQIEPSETEEAWEWGDAKAERYQTGGAPHYGLRRHRLWDVNVACPRPAVCRRKRGCVYAPGPWPTPGACVVD